MWVKRILTRRTLLFPMLALVFGLLLLPISAGFAGEAESDMDALKDIELTGISDGKTIKLGALAAGRPLFLVFSTPT